MELVLDNRVEERELVKHSVNQAFLSTEVAYFLEKASIATFVIVAACFNL